MSIVLVLQADRQFSYKIGQNLRQGFTPRDGTIFSESDQIALDIFNCRMVALLKDRSAKAALQSGEVAAQLSSASLQQAQGQKDCPLLPLAQVVEAGIHQAAQASGWRVILLVLRGDRMPDTAGLGKIQALAAASNATLVAVKYLPPEVFPPSTFSPREPVNLLVSSLGGISVFSSLEDLPSVMKDLIISLRQRYILSFPRPSDGDAGSHKLEVSSSVKQVLVRSSAVSAPPINQDLCKQFPDTWLCSKNRPEFGPVMTVPHEKK